VLALAKPVGDRGIQLQTAGNENNQWVVPALGCLPLCMSWTPHNLGPVREVVQLLWASKHRLQITLHGEGCVPKASARGRLLAPPAKRIKPNLPLLEVCASPVKPAGPCDLGSPVQAISPLVDRSNTIRAQAGPLHQQPEGAAPLKRSARLQTSSSSSWQSLRSVKSSGVRLRLRRSQEGPANPAASGGFSFSQPAARPTAAPLSAAKHLQSLGSQRKTFTYLMKGCVICVGVAEPGAPLTAAPQGLDGEAGTRIRRLAEPLAVH
jgi:hypothetical protein